MEQIYLPSNTWRRCISSERNVHVSHPYMSVGWTVALYTPAFVVGKTSVLQKSECKVERAAWTLTILEEISSAITVHSDAAAQVSEFIHLL